MGVVILRVFGVAILSVVAIALVAPRNSWFVYDQPLVLVSSAVALGLGWLMWVRRDAVLIRRVVPPGNRRLVIVGTVVVTLVTGVLAGASLMRFGWDSRAVANAARTLAEGGSLDAHQIDYFARFPNNVPFLWVETLAARAGALIGLPAVASLVIVQVALVAVITYCLGALALVQNRARLVLPVQVLAGVLLGWSPHVATPYTDIPGAACVAVAVLALAHAHRTIQARARLVWLVVAVVALSLGFGLKPYVAVILIAMAIVAVTSCLGGRSWPAVRRTAVGLAAGLVLVAVTVTGFSQVAQHGTGLTEQRLQAVREPFPVELWMASGTYDSGESSSVRRYGAYNEVLVDEAAAIADPGAQRVMLRELIATQVSERGMAGNLQFFAAKVAWVWGDGTFWAHGEGTDSQQPTYHSSGPLKTISEWTLATGEHYRTRAAIVQGIWLAVLLIVGLTALRAPYDRLHTIWALALVGLSGYLMIFEARPRYVLALVTVVIATLTFSRPARPDR